VTKPADSLSQEQERLRTEAAAWFARMRREDRQQFELAFERWLADPEHRAVYNRLASRFADAKLLYVSDAATMRPPHLRSEPAPARLARPLGLAVLAASLGAAWLVLAPADWPQWKGPDTTRPMTAELESGPGRINRYRLVDGSLITLDSGARVAVQLDHAARSLRIVQGRARFGVAHEARPFTVDAGSGRVTATGTLFDVTLTKAGASVALIEGAVEVTNALSRTGVGKSGPIRRMKVGETVSLANGTMKPLVAGVAPADWARTTIELRDAPLQYLLDRANRLGATRLEADPAIAQLRISGRFRLDDPRHLGTTLARLLDLHPDHTDPRSIRLRRLRQDNRNIQ
jgi:transmembrane sensor